MKKYNIIKQKLPLWIFIALAGFFTSVVISLFVLVIFKKPPEAPIEEPEELVCNFDIHKYGRNFNEQRKNLGLMPIPEYFHKKVEDSRGYPEDIYWFNPERDSLKRKGIGYHDSKRVRCLDSFMIEEDVFYSGRVYKYIKRPDRDIYPEDYAVSKDEVLYIDYIYNTKELICHLGSSTNIDDPAKGFYKKITKIEADSVLKAWNIKKE